METIVLGRHSEEPLVCWNWTVEVALFLFSEMGRQNLFDIKAVGHFVWSRIWATRVLASS